MHSFKQYLTEESGSLQQMLDLYNEDYSDWPLMHPLGRVDTRSISKMQVLKPRAVKREKSMAGSHMLQRVLASQPSWKEIPDRDFSIFTTSSPGKGSFATMNRSADLSHLAIIPKNGTKCAMIQDDFNKKKIEFGNVNRALWRIFNDAAMNDLRLTRQYIQDKQTRLRAPEVHDAWSSWNLYKFLQKNLDQDARANLERDFGKFAEFMEFASKNKLPPEHMGITTFTPDTYRPPSKPHEVWFHGDALAIPILQYAKFVQLVNNQ